MRARLAGLIMGAALVSAGESALAGQQIDVARTRAQQFDQAAATLLAQAVADDASLGSDSFLAGVQSRAFDVTANLRTALVDANVAGSAGPSTLGKSLVAAVDGRGNGWIGATRPVDEVRAGDAASAEWMHAVRPVDVVRVGPAVPVPEPSTFALLAAGLAVCVLRALGRKPRGPALASELPAQ